ncbi:MAG: hypothetical protein STHCBS139747_004155 [Sporothrix thermara]
MESIENLKRELERQRLLHEETKARLRDERRQREEAEQQREEAKQQREEAEARIQELEKREAPSCFLDYVRWTEQVLFQTFHIRPALMPKTKTTGSSSSITTGTASSARTTSTWRAYTATRISGKFYPRILRRWDFESAHASLFPTLVDVFGEDKAFPALTDVLGVSRDLSPGPVDEQDLRFFIRAAIEKPAARVVTELLRREHKGDDGDETSENDRNFVKITFQNNPFGLDLAQPASNEAAEDMAPLEQPSAMGPPPSKRRRSPIKAIGVPDRWCCGLDHDGSVTHILVGEYKAAHKLPADKLSSVFSKLPGEDFFIQALKSRSVNPEEALDPPLVAARKTRACAGQSAGRERLLTPEDMYIACVLIQAYHYMIATGLELGYVASGDGLVFLRVPIDDPQTLEYFWSIFPVPAPTPESAKDSTDNSETAATVVTREPHQTAMAYLTSLCMLAMKSPVRPMSWIDARERDLARWPNPYSQALPLTTTMTLMPPPQDPPDKDGQGGGSSGSTGGGQGATGNSSSGGGSTGGSAPVHGSNLKRPHSSHVPGDAHRSANSSTKSSTNSNAIACSNCAVKLPKRPYCTQACLLSLCTGAPLDGLCPNVALHRAKRPPLVPGDGHPLTVAKLCAGIVAQLAENMDCGCQSLEKWGYFGRSGVLFKMELSGYGYTFVAKGVQGPHRSMLQDEAVVYKALKAYQGRLIPVFLGLADLVRPLPLQGLARVPHLMLLSYAGPRLPTHMISLEEVDRTTAELEAAGLWNDDAHLNNMTWNEEVGRIMLFDFGQAVVRKVQQTEQTPTKQDCVAYKRGASEDAASQEDAKRPRRISA